MMSKFPNAELGATILGALIGTAPTGYPARGRIELALPEPTRSAP